MQTTITLLRPSVEVLQNKAQWMALPMLAVSMHVLEAGLYYLLPPFLLLSCFTGWVNGAIANYITARLQDHAHG